MLVACATNTGRVERYHGRENSISAELNEFWRQCTDDELATWFRNPKQWSYVVRAPDGDVACDGSGTRKECEKWALRNAVDYADENAMVFIHEGVKGPAFVYGALCRGLLTGKITAKTEFKGDDLRKVDPKFQQPRLGHYLAAVARLDAFARERYGKTVLALAVRWLLDRGKIVALWGARRPDQLAPVKDVMGWTLDGSAMREIDRILAETIKDEVGPEFMAPQPSRTA